MPESAVDPTAAAAGDEPTAEGPAAAGPAKPRFAAPLIGVLCLLLGFALVIQVKATSGDSGLAAARQEDLVRILDDLSAREERLRQDIATQEQLLGDLRSGDDLAGTALEEAQQREQRLAILAGTVAATGPGIRLSITDPVAGVGPDVILDAIQELRAAGAEALQIGEVRLGADTAVIGSAGALVIDDVAVAAPYVILAIGDPPTLETALSIPGGVVNTVNRAGAVIEVQQQDSLVVSALRAVRPPQYARPAPETD